MKYIQILIILSAFTVSCTSEEKAVNNFYSCLPVRQRTVLKELELVCDKFINYNYPELSIDEGYRQFLKDLEAEKATWATNDLAAVSYLDKKLKTAFGEYYNTDKGYFSAYSSLTNCLEKTSNSKFVEDNYSCGGGLGPNLIAWSIINNKLDPISGQIKIIYQTEVIYRILQHEATKTIE